MRLATVCVGTETVFGVIDGDVVLDLRGSYRDIVDVLVAGRTARGRSEIEDAAWEAPAHRLDRVRFLPPIASPEHILCVGANYRNHVDESSFVDREPERPLLFARFASSLVGHGAPLIRPSVSDQFDYEGELAVVIGDDLHRADPATAATAIAGYSCFMDGTVRDFQRHTSQFTPGKNFDRSGAWGPWIVTRDAVAAPDDLDLRTTIDHEVVQTANTSQMLFDAATIVSYCSSFVTLRPGDVIATGTPGGIGSVQLPPRWLEPGVEVTVEIDGVGALHNPVVDEATALAGVA